MMPHYCSMFSTLCSASLQGLCWPAFSERSSWCLSGSKSLLTHNQNQSLHREKSKLSHLSYSSCCYSDVLFAFFFPPSMFIRVSAGYICSSTVCFQSLSSSVVVDKDLITFKISLVMHLLPSAKFITTWAENWDRLDSFHTYKWKQRWLWWLFPARGMFFIESGL